MKRLFLVLFLIALVGLAAWKIYSPTSAPPPQVNNQVESKSTIPNFDHIVILVMENKPYQNIIGNTSAPYINKLAREYSSAVNFFATTHPSLPNYLAILGGDTFGVNSNCNDCFIQAENLVDRLETAQKSWKAYMDSMPESCFMGNSGDYAMKHNPFIYFDNIRKNPERCKNIVPYTELQKDLANLNTTPNFIWITPDMCHGMHDCSIKTGDDWLGKEIPNILNSPSFKEQNSLLIITWDEADLLGSNQIPTLLIGPSVKQNFVSQTKYDHYSLLHTIEAAWGLTPLTDNDKNAALMNDFFK